jgi:predicted dehydrogenase
MRVHSHGMTRRQLLATSGAVGVGLATSFSLERALAEAQDNNREIRVGLVGCGGRGTGAAEQALSVPGSNVKLVAMADAFEDRLRRCLTMLQDREGVSEKVDVPADRQFIGLDAYRKVIELCDLVVLATPPGFRPDQFEAAVQAGKHIFMEKPVCVDAYGARKCLDVAKQADAKNLKVVVGLQRHYQDSYLETLKRVRDGAIGDIVSGNVYWNGQGIWFRSREPGMTEMQYQVHNWYHFCWLSGDHIVEQHVHNIDVANWFLDAIPLSAYGFGGRQVRTPGKSSEIYDHHTVEFRYPNGVVINSTCRQFPGTSRVTEEFQGTKGIARPGEITDHKGNVVWKYAGSSQERGAGRRRGQANNPYQVEHNALHAAIRTDQPLNNAHYGTTSSFSAVLGRYATYTGKIWTWDEAIQLAHRTMPETLTWDATPPTLPDKDGNYRLPMPGEYQLG